MNPNTKNYQTEEKLVHEEEIEQLKQCLPKANFMGCTKFQLVKFQGFWIPANRLPFILAFLRHFHAKDTDLLVTSLPKTGTTWLKSLLFSVVNRDRYHPNQSPLLNHSPHDLVYHLEGVYGGFNPALPRPDQLDELSSPRLFQIHLPYASLCESIKSSACKILYIARNPLDTIVSNYHFYPNMVKKIVGDDFEPPRIEDYFEDFVEGNIIFGSYFDHVMGYWKQSLEQSDKVLFLKYEDLKDDSIFHLKRLAEFVGLPFSPQEESEGVIEDIIELCSIKSLKELEVNKTGFLNKYQLERNSFFRKGEIGDWTNYFSPPLVERMHKIMEEKFKGTGLSFRLLPISE